MDINKIYESFYAKDSTAEKSASQKLDELTTQLRSVLPCDTYNEIEEKITEAFTQKEKESFKDGFSMGLSHIIQALAFANSRIG